MTRCICVHTGAYDRVTTDGIELLTVRSFLSLLESGKLFAPTHEERG
jgi:hypothetical protein